MAPNRRELTAFSAFFKINLCAIFTAALIKASLSPSMYHLYAKKSNIAVLQYPFYDIRDYK